LLGSNSWAESVWMEFKRLSVWAKEPVNNKMKREQPNTFFIEVFLIKKLYASEYAS
jgi:hypothetical protein